MYGSYNRVTYDKFMDNNDKNLYVTIDVNYCKKICYQYAFTMVTYHNVFIGLVVFIILIVVAYVGFFRRD